MKSGSQQQIIFVSGKGGVGKSVVAAALALDESRKGKKTLLVELGYQSFYQDYFNLHQVGFQPVHLKENLDVAIWSGPDALKEYVLYLVKLESLYTLFFENPVSKALLNVAPALPELAMTGKITSGIRKVGPALNYDCIVIDGFATGHFLALLKAPQGMAQAIKIGPMADQALGIEKVLKNPEHSKYYVVSFPEELPVVEALELSKGIADITGIKPTHILNRFMNFPGEVSGNLKPGSFMEQMKVLQERQAWALNEFKKRQESVKILPFTFHSDPWKVVESLAQEIEK